MSHVKEAILSMVGIIALTVISISQSIQIVSIKTQIVSLQADNRSLHTEQQVISIHAQDAYSKATELEATVGVLDKTIDNLMVIINQKGIVWVKAQKFPGSEPEKKENTDG